MREIDFSKALLGWYDAHARVLPWRVPPAQSVAGVLPDPYHIWLSEVMLQQTTVAAVVKYFNTFTKRWPNIQALATAQDADVMAEWAGLGYYARARNLLKCARMIVNDHGGVFPNDRAALLALPGIGPYTAAAISAIAFGRSACVVDGNVERVMARLFNVITPLPAAKPELTAHAAALTPVDRAGDYAQAVMDLGATICTPKSPGCGICPCTEYCAALPEGDAANLPLRPPKPAKPIRYGTAYIARRHDGAWLLERRPDNGLLGGMLGWPGSEWGEEAVENPPFSADWQRLDAQVRHTFTHFHLRLSLRIVVAKNVIPTVGMFIPSDKFDPDDLPTVMRKAHALADAAFDHG